MLFELRALLASLLLLGLASPALAESPFGSPAWVREQEALRQAEDARRGRKPAAPRPPEAVAPAAPSDSTALAPPPEPEAPTETALAEPPSEDLPLPQVAPSANPLSRMAFKELGGFRHRPLFAPSRRRPDRPVAYAPPPPPPGEAPASPPPDLRLVGIVAGVDRAVALVSRQEGASLSLRVGDQVDAWRVDRIAPDRVVLREGEREQTYRLFALPPAAAPGARLPAGAVVRLP